MSNPNINFRLSHYQLARGLWLIRKLEPTYKPSSASQMVKLIYTDYIAKMNYGRSDIVPPEIVTEVEVLCSKNRAQDISFETFINQQKGKNLPTPEEVSKPTSNPIKPDDDKSVITTVTDFSPSADWLIDEDS